MHQPFYLTDFSPRKSTAALHPHGVQPELGNIIVPFDVNMSWFGPVTRVKEKPIRTMKQDCRHIRKSRLTFAFTHGPAAAAKPRRQGHRVQRVVSLQRAQVTAERAG